MVELLRAPSRKVQSMIMDSQRWDGFRPRPDDIVIATYPKCGTTWTQRIVDLLVFQSPAPRTFNMTSPWLDATFFATVEQDLATLEAQPHRRFIKSHLPLDALPIFDSVKYIHVARDGRDACVSMHNHQLGFRREVFAAQQQRAMELATTPAERERAARDVPEHPRDYFLQWMDDAEAEDGGGPSADLPYCEFEMTYWQERRRENLLFVHYADLKADLAGEMRRISTFLEIDTPEPLLHELAEAAKFETMKRQGDEMLPNLAFAFDHGAQRFINKGVNGRWKDMLTPEDLARYDALIERRLPAPLARWLEHGRLETGDPRGAAD